MDYNVVITQDAATDLDNILYYLLYEKESLQAARNVNNDYEATVNQLKIVAGSLKLCGNPALSELGYRRINFLHHNYFMMYRMDGNTAIIDKIFHGSQDYENKII